MAIYTLAPPPNETGGGTWAISTPNTCTGLTITGGNILNIPEPFTTSCTVVLTYTVTSGACQDISTHEITITPKTCVVTGGIADPSDWQLNLAPLTINGVTQDNFLYAIVPENDDCATWDNAVAWGYKGTPYSCPKYDELTDIFSTDTTPKTNFDDLSPITTFQVPAGDYKLVVVCSEYTLGTCEKIDCCGVNVTVTDLDLCTDVDNCAGETLSYTTNDNFTIYIPMVVTQDKCVRMDFFGGGSVLDRIDLEVNTGTYTNPIWATVDLNLQTGDNFIFTQNEMSIIVRCALTSALPNIPILPAGSQIVLTDKYQLRWKVSRSGSGTTNWTVKMSCCDCLQICPVVIPTCITNVDVDPAPTCPNCLTTYIEGNYGYSKDEYLNLIAGSCNPGSTCLGTAPYGAAYSNNIINNLGAYNPSSSSFKLYVDFNYIYKDSIVPPICGVKYRLEGDVTVSVTATTCTVDFTTDITNSINSNIYFETKAKLSALLLTDYSNIQIRFGGIYVQGTDLGCGDLNTLVGTPPSFFMVNNGVPVSIAFNDSLFTVTFTNIHLTTGACVNMLLPASPKEEIFQCHYPLSGTPITGDIIGNNVPYLIEIAEIVSVKRITTYAGNAILANVCPALAQVNYCTFLDETLPADTWILTSISTLPTTCIPILGGGTAYLIYQGSATLNFSASYDGGTYTPITGNTCEGWLNTITNAYYIKDTSYVSGYCV